MKKSNILEYVIAFLFTFAGGFCDAYTLIYRRGLFANMQTGNLVKFCISLADGSFEPMYFLPIICFLLGCLIAILVNKKKSHNIILLIVMLALTIVLYKRHGTLSASVLLNDKRFGEDNDDVNSMKG